MTYVRRQVKLVVTEHQNSQGVLIKRGDGDVRFDALDSLAEAKFTKQAIAMPATDIDMLQGTSITTVKILFIETDTELLVKLEGTGDTGITVKPIDDTDATKRGTLYLEGEFTRVLVTPTGSTGDATVLLGVVGA